MPWLMATLYDRLTERVEEAGLAQWRRDLLSTLSGTVLEIGAGTGRNLPHYPRGLDRLVLTEPDRFMRARLQQGVDRAGMTCPVEVVDAPAEALSFPDRSFDAVVGTLVLCSVGAPRAVLTEVRRVLRPGGLFLFIEHVAATDRPSLLRWQQRLEPIWKRLAGGCHLTRQTGDLIQANGFHLEYVQQATMRKAPPVVHSTVRGAARRP